jgi:hypothetical protein
MQPVRLSRSRIILSMRSSNRCLQTADSLRQSPAVGVRPFGRVASPETMQRIGYAVGAAAVGIAANLSGLAAGISGAAAKSAAFWVFAAFVPVLLLALMCAWTFTARDDLTPGATT